MPVFFGMAPFGGSHRAYGSGARIGHRGLVLIASIGKFSGAFLGGKIAGMSLKEATAVGCAMNACGSTEVIVASIGLSINVLSHDLFTMIATMAVVTTLAMPPTLRWVLRRLPMEQSEKERVDREPWTSVGSSRRWNACWSSLTTALSAASPLDWQG